MNRRDLIQLVAAGAVCTLVPMAADGAQSTAKNARVRILRLDEPSRFSGLIYPTDEMQATLNGLKGAERAGIPVMGCIGIPDDGLAPLDRLSHMVSDLAIEDGWLVGTIKVLDTPDGRTLRTMSKVDFRVCGIGRVDDTTDKVVREYRITTINAHTDGTT